MDASLDANIVKRYPGFQLDVTLACERGVNVLFGGSGAGKTLTLNCLAGLVRPDEGRILLNGEILFDAQRRVHVAPRDRGIGYVFQNDTLFPHMTVEQNLLFPLARVGVIERRRRARALLDTFRIGPLAARYPRDLSGGEKQRVGIARALAIEPRMLLLDEPARGLDHQLRQDFYRVLDEVRERHRIPILLVTHDRDEAWRLGERITVYRAGQIVQSGTAAEIFDTPRDAGVARLLGYGNIFEGVVEALDPAAGSSRLRTGNLALALDYLPGRLLGDRVTFCVPPHRIVLGMGENQVEADVVSESQQLSNVRLTLRADGLGDFDCETSVRPSGSRVTVSMPRAAIHVFPS